ncbi:MAG: inositol-3-phosphate synthase, partial [Deltaproteobacteria bacterium]|nr:inositol-3-phosphate synthase [Deltaproteobacteria bacterium]
MSDANQAHIRPHDGKLLVLIPGMGAVATTFIAGVESIRRGLSAPIGSVSQLQTIRIGPREAGTSPLIKDFLPLAPLGDLCFAGWDVKPDNVYEAAVRAEVLTPQHLTPLEGALSAIKPMRAAFDNRYVRKLDGDNVMPT